MPRAQESAAAVEAQGFAAPIAAGVSIFLAQAMAVERRAEQGVPRAMFRAHRRDMGGVMLKAQNRRAAFLGEAGREIIGMEVAGKASGRTSSRRNRCSALSR